MHYEIVYVENEHLTEAREELEKKVKRLISAGYKPQGGVSVSAFKCGYYTYYVLCQAMVKE